MATIAIPTETCKTLTSDLYGETTFPDLDAVTRPERDAYRQASQPEPLPEAAFSLTLKGTIGGHDALLTVRGRSLAEFQANVAAVRGMLDKPATTQPSAPVAPVQHGEGWCHIHGAQMRQNTKEGRSWWSHKVGDGWCKGK